MGRVYKITVEGSPYGWQAETISHADVVKLEHPDVDPASRANYRVTYQAKRGKKRENGELAPGETIEVVDNITFELERTDA